VWVSRDLDTGVEALSYLVTLLIHRLHESDPAWSVTYLAGLKADKL